jgi:hypothetical protein
LPVASLRKKYSSHRNVTRNETSKKKKSFRPIKEEQEHIQHPSQNLKENENRNKKKEREKKSVKMRATKKKNCLRSVRMSFEKMQNARRVM